MWNRWTERARKVVYYAQDVAGAHGHDHVSPEHLLHGLLQEHDTVAGILLRRSGCDPSNLLTVIEGKLPSGPGRTSQDLKLSVRSRQVMDHAYAEAKRLRNDWVGTEHLLMGIISEGRGIAFEALRSAGLDLQRTRGVLHEYLESAKETWPPAPTTRPPMNASSITSSPPPQTAPPQPQPVATRSPTVPVKPGNVLAELKRRLARKRS